MHLYGTQECQAWLVFEAKAAATDFCVQAGARIYRMKATTEAEAGSWVEAIQRSAALLSGTGSRLSYSSVDRSKGYKFSPHCPFDIYLT